MRRVITLMLLLATSLPTIAGRLDPFAAPYRLYRGDTTLGSGTVSLERGERDNCFVYSYTAKPSWVLRWITGSITESSRFCADANGRLEPEEYRYHRSGVGAKDENYILSFDPATRTVTDQDGHQRDYPPGAVDRLLVQIEALRLIEGLTIPPSERRLSVTQVEDDRIKTYTLGVVGSEEIKTPAGRFETILIERLNDPKKTTRFWVAPALDGRIVKVEQSKNDEPVIGIELKALPTDPVAADPKASPPLEKR